MILRNFITKIFFSMKRNKQRKARQLILYLSVSPWILSSKDQNI
jgi:hypothetical protein